MTIGILDLQGGVEEHVHHLNKLDVSSLRVKNIEQLDAIDGLVIPGGESTTIGHLLRVTNLLQPLKQRIEAGMPVWGTCAGMILLAKNIENDIRTHLQVIDIKVRRNAYGTQLESFNTSAIVKGVSENKLPLVFIRAPYIVETGKNVEILCKVNENIVAAKENNILVTSFHPELTDNIEFHKYFINIVKNCQLSK